MRVVLSAKRGWIDVADQRSSKCLAREKDSGELRLFTVRGIVGKGRASSTMRVFVSACAYSLCMFVCLNWINWLLPCDGLKIATQPPPTHTHTRTIIYYHQLSLARLQIQSVEPFVLHCNLFMYLFYRKFWIQVLGQPWTSRKYVLLLNTWLCFICGLKRI